MARQRVPKRARPEEVLFGAFIAALAVLVVATGHSTVVRHGLGTGLEFVGLVVAVGVIIFTKAYYTSRARDSDRRARISSSVTAALRTLRAFSPLFACLAIYQALHGLTPVLRPHVVDQWLVDSDHFLLHVDAGRWLDDHIGSTFTTDVLTWCYLSYACASPLYAAYLYVRARHREFHDFALAITVTAVVGYCGYLLIPAVGPYLFQHDVYADRLPGWDPGSILDIIAKLKGSARDAFPSLHTAMTTVVLGCAWRQARKLFWMYLPVALGLYLATMYLRVHYATDVVAGFVLGGLALAAAPKINRWWYGRNAASGPEHPRIPLPRQPEAVSA